MNPRPLIHDFIPPQGRARKLLPLLGLLFALLAIVALIYLDASQTVSLLRAEKRARETTLQSETVVPRRSAEEARALRQEVQAVNRQIRQLNQSWETLFGDLRTFPGGAVRLLGVDVEARTGSVRVTGVAADATTMADYAAYLADKKSLRSVVLSRHEAEGSSLRFVVDAKWAVPE